MIYDEQKRQKATDAPPPPPKKLEREPQAIVMSHAKQEVVEKMLKDRYPRRVVDGKGGVREEWKRLEHRLMKDGFSKEDIHQAMHQATQQPTGSFAESVLDWLCFHLDESELPASFNKRKLRHTHCASWMPGCGFQDPRRTRSVSSKHPRRRRRRTVRWSGARRKIPTWTPWCSTAIVFPKSSRRCIWQMETLYWPIVSCTLNSQVRSILTRQATVLAERIRDLFERGAAGGR